MCMTTRHGEKEVKTVLVVEDDRAIAETIRMILEESYAVTLFETPCDMPPGTGPSLVITDLLARNGYDSAAAIRAVREVRARTGAPVLVLTAHGAAKADGELAAVANGVLTKPFQMDELLAVVERLIV
jgi:DNA-binding response OmpR family regulator